jgi:hypothetical protein
MEEGARSAEAMQSEKPHQLSQCGFLFSI